jgi:hypothetical protein
MSIKLHGKEYVEVKDRVLQAHKEESYSMLREETFSMGGREYVRIFIDVKGKQYIGTAECKFNANPKTPDGQSPLECGETSALGRALGFAGYGVTESIASADEVSRNVVPDPIDAPLVSALRERHKFLPMQDDWETVKYKIFKRKISDNDLTPEQCTTISGVLERFYETHAAQEA